MIRRVAALYDIHGNLPALEAVLEAVARAQVDLVVIGGDVLPGPMPNQCLVRLLCLSAPTSFIYGNGEVAVLRELKGETPAVPEQVRDVIRWTARQLDQRAIDEINTWPKTVLVDVTDVGRVLFCHATPRNENECFTNDTAEERLLPVFADAGATLIVCGHTHMQFDRMVGRTRVVNAGSVGMPFGQTGADWLLVDNGRIALQHTDYDLASAAARVRQTDYPHRDDFAAKNILESPAADEMRKAFERVELK